MRWSRNGFVRKRKYGWPRQFSWWCPFWTHIPKKNPSVCILIYYISISFYINIDTSLVESLFLQSFLYFDIFWWLISLCRQNPWILLAPGCQHDRVAAQVRTGEWSLKDPKISQDDFSCFSTPAMLAENWYNQILGFSSPIFVNWLGGHSRGGLALEDSTT